MKKEESCCGCQYWNLACDITVENIIDGLYLKCVHQPASMVKRQALKLILEEGKVMTAQRIYRRLPDSSFAGK